jgi:NAD(P)-dependent dehydrogenase (short-subunit alcohol dehydrogenase family)
VGLLAAALPHLQTAAAIVNISSMKAIVPPTGTSDFETSKAAFNLWTCPKKLGPHGIRVNAAAKTARGGRVLPKTLNPPSDFSQARKRRLSQVTF